MWGAEAGALDHGSQARSGGQVSLLPGPGASVRPAQRADGAAARVPLHFWRVPGGRWTCRSVSVLHLALLV